MNNSKEFKPIELTCKRCHMPFIWSVGEQEWLHIFKDQGRIQEICTPVRCHKCRAQKKEYWDKTYGTNINNK